MCRRFVAEPAGRPQRPQRSGLGPRKIRRPQEPLSCPSEPLLGVILSSSRRVGSHTRFHNFDDTKPIRQGGRLLRPRALRLGRHGHRAHRSFMRPLLAYTMNKPHRDTDTTIRVVLGAWRPRRKRGANRRSAGRRLEAPLVASVGLLRGKPARGNVCAREATTAGSRREGAASTR